jgi:nucleobase transporter 1/2
VRNENEPVLALNPDGERKVGMRENVNVNGGNGHGVSSVAPVQDEKDEEENVVQDEVKVDLFPEGVEPVDGGWNGPSELKCGLQENPGFG